MKKLCESFIKRRGMLRIPPYRIKRDVAKPLRKFYQKRSRQLIAYPQLSRQLTSCTRMPDALAYVDASSRGATLDRIKRGVAL